MEEIEKFSKSQIATLKHIQKKGFAGYRRVDGKPACPIQKKLFYHALAVGKKRNIDYIANGKRPPLALELEYKIVNKT